MGYKTMNETIELPWIMRSSLIYSCIGMALSLFFFSITLGSFLERREFTVVYFIPISIGVLTWFGSIRSIRFSVEGMTLIYGFVFFKAISWENIKAVEFGRAVDRVRGGGQLPYSCLLVKTKSNKVLKIVLHWFRQEDFEKLVRILRNKTFPFSMNFNELSIP